MNPLINSSQQYAIDRVEALQHPAIFRFGQVPPQHHAAVATGYSALDDALNGGWPTARLIEVLCDRVGVGELSLLLSTMPKLLAATTNATTSSTAAPRRANARARTAEASNLTQRALWVMPNAFSTQMSAVTKRAARASGPCVPCVPYAPALAARGIDLKQLAIVQTTQLKDTLWTMEQALLSNAVKRVFGWALDHASLDDFSLRRLAIAARKSESLCFLMRPLSAVRRATPAEVRIAITPSSRHEIEVAVLKRRGLLHETSVCLDPRALACLAPHRTAIEIPVRHEASMQRTSSPLIDRSNVLAAIQPPAADAPKIRERSFILDR